LKLFQFFVSHVTTALVSGWCCQGLNTTTLRRRLPRKTESDSAHRL